MSVDPHTGREEFVNELERTAHFHGSRKGEANDLSGKVIAGRYRVIEKLGEGGMGSVYRAEHVEIGKPVAIKVLASHYAQDDQQRRRFLREARAASTIAHENVVDVTDFGPAPGGSVFLAMELLVGEELSDLMARERPLPWARIRQIIAQICGALQAAHDKGIFHRDVKPENCFLIKRGNNEDFIKVLDFGIAKIMSQDLNPDQSLSQAGMVFGTPEYMSPEQARGTKVDHRADVYAVGVVLYEMVAGKVPFDGASNLEILARQANDLPTPPSEMAPHLDISPEVEAIVLRALQKHPDDRFRSVRELCEAVEAVQMLDASAEFTHANARGTGVALDKTRERLYITIIVLLGLSVLALGAVLLTLILRG